MPRQTLGQNKAAGPSRKLEVKYTEPEREAIESVLDDGESLSEFTRAAWKLLVRQRQRKKGDRP